MSEVEFFGETFTVPERFNHRLLTRFAKLARKGVDSDDSEGMAAIDDLIDQCVMPYDMERFDAVCDRERPSFEELMEFMHDVLEAISARPTGQPSDSSDGLQTTSPNSADGSPSAVVARLEQQGRPDLALMVTRAQESRVSA